MRCQHPDHIPNRLEPFAPVGNFKDENTGKYLCHQHYFLTPNGKCRAIRREIILLGALFTNFHRHKELEEAYVGHDFNVFSCQLIRRPDMLFVFSNFALLIECDENGHIDRSIEEENNHLLVIKQWVEQTYDLSKLYQVRINPDGKKSMFNKIKSTNGEQMWNITKHGEQKMLEVFDGLRNVIDCGLDGSEIKIDELFTDSVEGIVTKRLFFKV